MEYCFVCYAILIFVLYKILDRLIRIPFVGRFNERYILVTGCDTGFGNELAKRLDGRGCHVFAGCLTEKGETEIKKVCSDRLITIPLDVSKSESVQKAHELIKSKLPDGKGLWGVMNNAGILGPSGQLEWLKLDDYKPVMNVNLFGLIDVTMTFLPLVKLEHGRVVNTASVFGRFSLEKATPYSISKFGVEAFTDALRRSLRVFGCKAVLIEPGIHKTNIASFENISSNYESTWQQATPEVKEEFGDDYHTYMVTKHVEGYEKVTSPRISDVVDAYEHALLGFFPRARYPVGKDAVFLWVPLTLAPEWLSDLVNEKMDAGRPLPAAVLKKKE